MKPQTKWDEKTIKKMIFQIANGAAGRSIKIGSASDSAIKGVVCTMGGLTLIRSDIKTHGINGATKIAVIRRKQYIKRIPTKNIVYKPSLFRRIINCINCIKGVR